MSTELRDSIRRNAESWERRADQIERFPRFAGDPEAQRRWLGATDAERIARLRYAAGHARSALARLAV